MAHQFQSSAIQPSALVTPAFWFAFKENRLLLHAENVDRAVPFVLNLAELGIEPAEVHYLGVLDQTHCFAVQLSETCSAPNGLVFTDLRSSLMTLDESLAVIAGRAFQIVYWDRTHQFCGQCGSRTEPVSGERAKKCPRCRQLYFPRLAPAIIVLVRRGRELLLARSHLLPSGMYSILAGFVEPGETLEEAVAREVTEETGISIRNIQYFGSQPWPFPHSLMIGFKAEYAGGELNIDPNELEDANWYWPDALPVLPPSISIARRLIDSHLAP
jgi:NAD+ diphosphatase